MSIKFVSRRDGKCLDADYDLWSGKGLASLEGFLVGDDVRVLFNVSAEQAEAICRNHTLGIYADSNSNGGDPSYNDRSVFLPCIVKQRTHTMFWKDIGRFQDTGLSMALEATTDAWEDVLRWITVGEVPEWASRS